MNPLEEKSSGFDGRNRHTKRRDKDPGHPKKNRHRASAKERRRTNRKTNQKTGKSSWNR